LEGIGSEDLAQLGDQSIEPGLTGRGEVSGPEGIDHLVTAAESMAVEDKVGEEKPTLAPG
jgi:hypothetical protein